MFGPTSPRGVLPPSAPTGLAWQSPPPSLESSVTLSVLASFPELPDATGGPPRWVQSLAIATSG